MTGRVVLVETSELLPGLLPYPAWEALAAADVVYARDPDRHPSAPYLAAAGLELRRLEGARLDLRRLDLGHVTDPADQRLAAALVDLAGAHGSVTFLLGPEDDALARALAVAAPARDVEIEVVFCAPLPRGVELLRLVAVEQRLRDPERGCPWDLEQDHRSLLGYLLEETYELAEAIEDGVDEAIAEELGDLLLQVVFHAQIATDRGAFTIDDVARGIADKLVRRHPHVFGDVEVADAEEVIRNWHALKEAERGAEGPFAGVPRTLPALAWAAALLRRAARAGLPAPEPAPRLRAAADALLEAPSADTLAGLLLAAVAVAVDHDLDAEQVLRGAARRLYEAGGDPDTLATAWTELWGA